MKQKIKELIAMSGKHKSVDFKGKDKRTSFDESFGKDKIDLINKVLGTNDNKKAILNKVNGH